VSVTAAAPPRRHDPPLVYQVVHRLPGRVRVRLSHADARRGAELAELLASHPSVTGTRWAGPARSLTVTFDPTVSGDLELMLTEAPGGSVREPAHEPERPFWKRFLLPGVSLVAGILGLGWVSAAAIAVCAVPVVLRAALSLRARRLSIDVLDTIAVCLLLGMGDTLAAGVSVALIEAGERMREQASGRARRVLRGWLGVTPDGIRIQVNGSEPRVPVERVARGDRVVIYAGESVPVDGVVVGGSATLDTRTWTGEALPRMAALGSTVLAGCALTDGRLVVEVTATGDETRAGRLSVALEEALAANTHVADLARRIADRFVLPVLLVSGGVLVATRQVARAAAILIFDYGTGVRIAIPTTVLATMIVGARRGVLFKSGRALEDLAAADTIVFDKTGTLTSGVLNVQEVDAEDQDIATDALRLAAAAEGHLPHPVARAIRRAGRRQGLELPEPEWVRYHVGGGVEALVEGHEVLAGDARLLEERNVAVPRDGPESLSVHIAVDGRHLARVRLTDRVKATAAGALEELRRAGIQRLWLASGDRSASASAVCRRLGLDGYAARLMPEDKVSLVERFKAEGSRVAVVGDGINDAPAMAAADVSVAVPRGADLAREAADIVLLSEDLGGLVTAVELSRAATGIVRQNIGLVGGPNSVGMILATLGLLTPLGATILNNGSTVLAGLNGLRPLRMRAARGWLARGSV
jgi:P-type Cu2+ transporter